MEPRNRSPLDGGVRGRWYAADIFEAEVLESFSEVLPLDVDQELTLGREFFEMGGDSLGASVVCSVLSSRLSVSVELEDLLTRPSVEQLAELLRTRINAGPRRGSGSIAVRHLSPGNSHDYRLVVVVLPHPSDVALLRHFSPYVRFDEAALVGCVPSTNCVSGRTAALEDQATTAVRELEELSHLNATDWRLLGYSSCAPISFVLATEARRRGIRCRHYVLDPAGFNEIPQMWQVLQAVFSRRFFEGHYLAELGVVADLTSRDTTEILTLIEALLTRYPRELLGLSEHVRFSPESIRSLIESALLFASNILLANWQALELSHVRHLPATVVRSTTSQAHDLGLPEHLHDGNEVLLQGDHFTCWQDYRLPELMLDLG
jgi:acyl carrier protein